ncbi:MAG: c-type cytochrome [Gammaproteobacteria bacterium]|nr:c-type cytochrome [Gammaproteobacteria bacterium]
MIRRFALIASFALLGLFVFSATGDEEEEWKRREAIAANLKPFGKLCLIGEDCGTVIVFDPDRMPRGTGLSGKGVYDKYCFACHDEGVADAPLVASEAWDPRVAQGYDVLLQHTKDGFGEEMPPMGTCVDCTDSELEAAIRYLITGEEETETEEDTEDEES